MSDYFRVDQCPAEISPPAVLDGTPVLLAPEAARLPLHMLDAPAIKERTDPIDEAYIGHIQSIATFVGQLARNQYPDIDSKNTGYGLMRDPKFAAAELVRALTPKQRQLKTGHLRNFTFGVVQPESVPEDILQYLDKKTRQFKRIPVPETSVLTLASAELYSGRSLGRIGQVARIAIAGKASESDPTAFTRITYPAFTLIKNLNTNDMLAAVGLSEAIATAQEVKRWQQQNPMSGGLM